MGVALALATHTGIDGVRLLAARLLATNARMGVAVAVRCSVLFQFNCPPTVFLKTLLTVVPTQVFMA